MVSSIESEVGKKIAIATEGSLPQLTPEAHSIVVFVPDQIQEMTLPGPPRHAVQLNRKT
jgi:hypothetical protein